MNIDECREFIALMRETGCARLKVDGFEAELGPEPTPEQNAEDIEEKKASGVCIAPGCKEKSGHLKTPCCAKHFQQMLKAGRL